MSNYITKFKSILNVLSALSLLLALPYQALAKGAEQEKAEEIFFQKSYLMLSTRKYEELERNLNQYLDLYVRNQISAEDLSDKFNIFSRIPGPGIRYDEWVHAYPKSYAARLARGIYRVEEAWEKRGADLARNTSDSQFRSFRDVLLSAETDLLSSLKLYSRPLVSYTYLIRVSKGLGKGDERQLLDSALKIDPAALYPRFDYFEVIAPKWRGSEEMMTEFYQESLHSPMSEKNKKRIEGKYFYLLGEQASFEKNYKAAADNYYKYYLTNNKPENLQKSGQAFMDGDFMDLAFQRFDELVNDHPEYCYGHELRGYLYEFHLNKIGKAIKDYLRAAELGANWSQNRMGWFFMMGINVPVDYVKARHLLDLAAAQGNNTAKENLVILGQLLAQSSTSETNTAAQPHKLQSR